MKKLKELHQWANHGWPTIWLQTTASLLTAFGVVCALRVEPDIFALGAVTAFAQLFIPDEHLRSAGVTCIAVAIFLALLTFDSQRRQFARFKKEQTMLQRQDWRK